MLRKTVRERRMVTPETVEVFWTTFSSGTQYVRREGGRLDIKYCILHRATRLQSVDPSFRDKKTFNWFPTTNPWAFLLVADLGRASPLSRAARWSRGQPWRRWGRRGRSGWRSSTRFSSGSWWWRWHRGRALDSTRTPPRFWLQVRLQQIKLTEIIFSEEYRSLVVSLRRSHSPLLVYVPRSPASAFSLRSSLKPSDVQLPNFMSQSWSSKGNQVMSILQVDLKIPGGM